MKPVAKKTTVIRKTGLSGYAAFLGAVKNRIRAGQVKATLAANAELIHLYWDIGHAIAAMQKKEGWGAGVIPRLARDIANDMPEVKGFSERNIARMIVFYHEYPDLAAILPKLSAKIPASGGKFEVEPSTLAQLPWSHHILLIQKVKDLQTRLWYARQTVEHGWSHNILSLQIDSRSYERQGKGGINAKLWIIGRAYATGIERMIPSKGTQGGSMEQLSDHLWNQRNGADRVLSSVQNVKEPLIPDMLTKILGAHGQFIGLVRGVLREGETPHSFVSKYLHFHNPAVPIFDSFAVRAATKHYRQKQNGALFRIQAAAGDQYADFLSRFWNLYEEARVTGEEVSVKLLDSYLLALAKEAK